MVRNRLAAAAALTLAVVTPAAANDRPAGSALACPVPAALSAPVLPLSPDSELEDKIDQLTDIIADLSDRLESLEGALGAPDDENGDDPDDDFALVHMQQAHHPDLARRTFRSVRLGQPLRSGKGLAPRAAQPSQLTEARAGATTWASG